ncbi:peroxiredoxin family protein [Chitinophaga lutea]|nr:redoxin domain-containing protein [Chitinophaga lutea]
MRILIIVTIVLSIILFGCSTPKVSPIEKLPSIRLTALDGKSTFLTDSLTEQQPVVLLWFDPECPNCDAEIRSIINNMDSLRHVQFVFLSLVSVEQIRGFVKHHQLNTYANIKVGQDTKFEFPKLFDVSSVPVTAVYGKNKALRQVFLGSATYSNILQEIKL